VSTTGVSIYTGKADDLADWSIVLLPDTQFYSESYPEIFESQIDWIIDNISEYNIKFVSQVGDTVDNNDQDAQWLVAKTQLDRLLDVVPHGVLPGNHDLFIPTNSQDLFRAQFPISRYSGKSWFGGYYTSDQLSTYQLFSAGGSDYIHLSLKWNPGTTGTCAWADGVLKTYPTRKAIISTHGYLYYDNPGHTDGDRTADGAGNGVGIWDTCVVPNSNVFMVLCGHNHGEWVRSDDAGDGRIVHQILSDYQADTNGGNGFLKLITFKPTLNTAPVVTYSPYTEAYYTDTDSQFTLDVANLDAPFLLQTVSKPDVGKPVRVSWPSLESETRYGWWAKFQGTTGNTTSVKYITTV